MEPECLRSVHDINYADSALISSFQSGVLLFPRSLSGDLRSNFSSWVEAFFFFLTFYLTTELGVCVVESPIQ